MRNVPLIVGGSSRKIHELFGKLNSHRKPTHLAGVRLGELVHKSYPIDLFEDAAENINLYNTLDYIKHRRGVNKIVRATTLHVDNRIRTGMNIFKE